jgi:hypothetical protein
VHRQGKFKFVFQRTGASSRFRAFVGVSINGARRFLKKKTVFAAKSFSQNPRAMRLAGCPIVDNLPLASSDDRRDYRRA